jgi:YD repeat-containing protein
MTVSYQYDAASNRTRLTYPDASYITYDYDQLNRMTAVKNSAGTALGSYSYDDRSRRTELGYANGARAQYSYDTASRLLSLGNGDSHQLKEDTDPTQ